MFNIGNEMLILRGTAQCLILAMGRSNPKLMTRTTARQQYIFMVVIKVYAGVNNYIHVVLTAFIHCAAV